MLRGPSRLAQNQQLFPPFAQGEWLLEIEARSRDPRPMQRLELTLTMAGPYKMASQPMRV